MNAVWHFFKQLSVVLFLTSVTTLAQAERVSLDKVVAIVDDDVVMLSELRSAMLSIMAQLKSQNTQLPPQEILQEQILEKLIVDRLQLSMAERYGVDAPAAEIDQAVARIQQRQGLSGDAFWQAAAKDGMNPTILREQIRRDLVIQQVQQANVKQRIRITEQEIDAFLESAEGKFWNSPDYHLGHILIPTSEAAEAKAQALYAELVAGADFASSAVANSAGQFALQGGDLGWRKLAQMPAIFAPNLEGLNKGDVSKPFSSGAGFHILKVLDKRGGEQTLVQQTKVSHILIEISEIMDDQQAKAKLEKIKLEIDNGVEFSVMAREHSQDIGSMLKGGHMGWANPGMFVPEFEKVMNASEIGEVSEPFKSQFGWHILLIEDRRSEDFSEQVIRNQASRLIQSRRYEEELQIWLQEIRARAYVDIKL